MLYKWNYTICDLWRKAFFFLSACCLWNITDRLETVSAMPSSRASSWPRDWTLGSWVSCIAGGFFFAKWPGKPCYIIQIPSYSLGLLWWLSGKKKSSRQWKRRRFNPWVGKISWRRESQPTPVFLPGKSHGQKSLVGYRPWGHKRVGYNLATRQL